MTIINGIVENLVLVEGFIPHREEVGEGEIPCFRRFYVKRAARVMRVNRMHTREGDADIRGDVLLLAIDEDLEMRMDVECRKHIRRTA